MKSVSKVKLLVGTRVAKMYISAIMAIHTYTNKEVVRIITVPNASSTIESELILLNNPIST